ncbi:glycosyltransferase family 39 protein, partial [bacterium]|nr:glycosyltransferase family 39 protein [bacterium]
MKLSRFAVLYIFIFSLPFAVRFMYALEVFTHDYLGALGVLGTLNHFFAVDILEGNGTPYMLFRPPFYPLILSLLYRFFGISPWIIRNVQWIAGGLCCWLIYWIASYCFNRKTGIVSLIIAGLYVPFIHFESLLTEQSLATFFVTASIACMLPFFIHGKQKKTCFAGAVLFGIGFLIRPDLLTAMPFIIIAFFLVPHETRSKMQVAAYACLILFGMLCLLLNPRFFLPVSGNHVSINASVNFYLGNNLHSDGYTPVFHDIPHIRSDHPDARKHHMTEITLAGIMHAKSNQVETLEKIPAFWMHKTIQSIISNPTHFITVL